jgi:GAF domain-containing protein
MARESLLISTLVELADNLVDNFDVIDVLTILTNRCVEAIEVDAAGVLLTSPEGDLQFIASSSESIRTLELFQVQSDEGPCVDCCRTGTAIVNHALESSDLQWPRFTPMAVAQGFRAVHCLPMRLRGRTIGALNLFRTEQGPLSADDVVVAQGLADVATIAIIQHRSTLDAQTLNDQLSHALNSRIIIEQAKGMVSQATTCSMDVAFDQLRAYARNHNARLTLVAEGIVSGTVEASLLVSGDAVKRR